MKVNPPPECANDPRVAAFCSSHGPEVFHAVAHGNEVWREDPFDVVSIHEEARAAFRKMVDRATTPTGTPSGRILLLLGEAGCGKTHLMRAFRNAVHARGDGYCGYMQMTASTNQYGRYALNNLIDSLSKPYYADRGDVTGLIRLSTALIEGARGLAVDRIERLRDEDLDASCLAKLVDDLADQIASRDERFDSADLDLLRALIFLQRDDPRIKNRILKYLRCEDLSPADRTMLGGLTPRTYDDAPQVLLQKLGNLIWSVESGSLIFCIDQLEDIIQHDDPEAKFRRAMATACDLAERISSSIVVIACLETFYEKMKVSLTKSFLDRIEHDPKSLKLSGNRNEGEIVDIVSRRLNRLYDAADVEPNLADPTFPIPRTELARLSGQRARDVLGQCHRYHEACIDAGRLVKFPVPNGSVITPPSPPLDQAWNDVRSSFSGDVPTEDDALMPILAWALEACSQEAPAGLRYVVKRSELIAEVTRERAAGVSDRLMVGLCEKSMKGGGLGNQVERVLKQAGTTKPKAIPIIARSTNFPTIQNIKLKISQTMADLYVAGGRKVVVEDADWRAMLAMQGFLKQYKDRPDLAGWLRSDQPLSQLTSIQAILDLDSPPADPVPDLVVIPDPVEPTIRDPEPVVPPPPLATDSLAVGMTTGRVSSSVTIELNELTRHSAFLGGSGSGKTTLALNLVEQLLLRGVPAILVDRKGDLCGYAAEDAWKPRPGADARAVERAAQLRDRAEVAVFTPGNPEGRPLSIAVVPAGLGRLPTHEREQVAKYAASALGGMLNYGARATDQSKLAVIATAIGVIARLEPEQDVSIEALIGVVDEAEPALVEGVGKLDPKLFGKVVQDLQTLQINRSSVLAAKGEKLDAEALLGLGTHAVPGKTRLSVVSTKFLGGNADVQFWVAQLLVELARWASRSPSDKLQAALLFDEADLYLPATRQPPTKEPMENLLRRGRSAGLGVFLLTQSPGDFDYKARDNVRNWFVGRIKEEVSLKKMKPMLSESRIDIAAKLPGQEPGQFHLMRDGEVTAFRADRPSVEPAQLPEEAILALARRGIR